ncbi:MULTISPECIES: cytochrome c1 [Ralstonia]|jgi:ubiquinol-cytochrome c reductase cytochrome c1 subunit|uniref:Ammonia monooxygenase gamma subunit n=5 Tax=Pseudomonadota TaxID=1224 RepID=A0AAD2F1N5_9RALS|nr:MULTISPECIES: cytochrome c1 [Ralstonia]MEA3268769.1 cytochrome c1 [Pseudomonadota bacterium]ENZ75717.1 cytochrome c1 [Ralstonia pickettii OR214]MBB0025891.1 cytochrome c1 [Ralstonia pickettii]MBB0036750.1 cytochrome c1 [Ralstonia pickettii]MBB0099219.1 cytochrome c1 [Ralstonia pickettii]
MKKLLAIFALAGLVFAAPVMANEGGVPLDPAPNQSSDTSALQRGAKLFVNYCLNCHGASAMRYNRLRDIGLSEEQIKQNLLFSSDKVGDTMHIAMDREDAKKWFGAVPPDLSVIARARGSDWLYTYLRTFYRDDTRPTGWNNLVFDKVGMPHVLWELQGQQVAKYAEVKSEHGEAEKKLVGLEVSVPGKMNKVEYDQAVADLVSYLDWMAEPAGNLRKRLGVWVLLFIGVFFVLAWRLNAAYWKDIK